MAWLAILVDLDILNVLGGEEVVDGLRLIAAFEIVDRLVDVVLIVVEILARFRVRAVVDHLVREWREIVRC